MTVRTVVASHDVFELFENLLVGFICSTQAYAVTRGGSSKY